MHAAQDTKKCDSNWILLDRSKFCILMAIATVVGHGNGQGNGQGDGAEGEANPSLSRPTSGKSFKSGGWTSLRNMVRGSQVSCATLRQQSHTNLLSLQLCHLFITLFRKHILTLESIRR